MKKLLMNLPILVAAAITVGFSTDLSFLRPLKTEQTFGWWLVVLVPAAIILFVTQFVMWVCWPATRPLRRPLP